MVRLFVFCVFSFLLFTNLGNAYSDHGSGPGGGGGGCSGDCSPPTLGKDFTGREYVKTGIMINNQGFPVEYFEQTIPTQKLLVGDPATISLRVFENSGPQNLTFVNLMLGLEEKIINGIQVPSHPVQITWQKSLEGITYLDVQDSTDLIEDVIVSYKLNRDAFGNEGQITEVDFNFTPLKTFNTEIILVETRDYERNSWTNYFLDAISIVDSSDLDIISESESQTESNLIPNWIKNNAGWWASDKIGDEEYIQGIQYLVENKILKTHPILEKVSSNDQSIPSWIKINSGWWAAGSISDQEYMKGLQYLINVGLIKI